MWSTPERQRIVVGIVAGALAFIVRLYGLGDVLTVDEPQWMFRAQAFTRAIAHGDPGGTFQGTHPGVVPMLLIGTGIKARELLVGEQMKSPTAGAFRSAAKFPVALAVSLGVGAAAAWLVTLWGARAGAAGGMFLALDPFFVGHSQLAHVDALLAVLMLLAILALLVYGRSGARRVLLLSGVLTGLALLTKLPAIVLFPLGAWALLLGSASKARFLRDLLLWGSSAGFTFLVLWPSLWINLLPNARYFTRDIQTVTVIGHVGNVLETTAGSPLFYVRALAMRSTPIVLFLAVPGLLLLSRIRAFRREAWVLGIFLLGFFAFLNVVEKRGDRYLLPALPVLDLLAGFSLATLWRSFRVGTVLAGVTAFALVLLNLLVSPYALGYRSLPNRWEEPTQSGWGEGLEKAAMILNAHPLASELQVATWYPAVFREFFRGETMNISSWNDHRVDYVVLYRNMRGRAPEAPATGILEAFRHEMPVATIRVAGREQAWVYQRESVDLFPEHVGEIVGAPASGRGGPARVIEAGQVLHPDRDGLSGVRLVFATFSSRENTGEIVVHLREHPDGPDLRTVRVPVSGIEDRVWRTVRFESLPSSAGKTYYLAVTSPDGKPGNAVTVKYQPTDLLPGSAVVIRSPLEPGQHRSDFARTGDLAYRLVYEE